MKKILYIGLLVLAFLFVACGSTTNTTSTQQPTATQTATQAPVQTVQTAAQIAQSLQQHGLPIGTIFTYTAENDLNHLLGRPGQYTSKVNFTDTRLPSSGDSGAQISVSDGGSVEVFATAADAQHRFAYLQSLSTSGNALFAEYEYLNGTSILRVSHLLTPVQAAAYKAAFTV